MADKTIGELPAAPSALTDYDGTELFVLEQSATAKKLRMQILENWLVSIANGHGGIQSIEKTGSAGTDPVVDTYTITYADENYTTTFTVTNGEKGDKGDADHMYIRYADTGDDPPTTDSQMGVIPASWIGIYTGLETDPSNLHVTDYTWYLYRGPKGDTGVSIGAVTYAASAGLTDTYTVWSDETTPRALGTLQVTNGSGGVSTVNGVSPDGNGNVELSPSDIGAVARSALLDLTHPVGEIYTSTRSTSPAELFGGTWKQIKDVFLLAAGDTYTAGESGGEAAHTLTAEELPAHTHGEISLAGSLQTRAMDNGGNIAASYDNGINTMAISVDLDAGGLYGRTIASEGSNTTQKNDVITFNASHEHESVGGSQAHNNMPPYLVVYAWERVA